MGRLALVLLLLLGSLKVSGQDLSFVVIDRAQASHWIVWKFPAAQRERLNARLGQEMEIVDWAAFKSNPRDHIGSVIVKNEYPEANLLVGLVELLDRYPQTAFAVTWTGGLAITRNDYVHATRIYDQFKNDPTEYERTRVSTDARRDPINPQNHLGPLLSRKAQYFDPAELTVMLMEVETVKLQKQVCEIRFPAYRQQNEEAYRRSPFSQVTSEQLIENFAESKYRDGLLTGVARDRQSTAAHFQGMNGDKFDQMCADFPRTVETLVSNRRK